jgi:hypothetical protein
MMEHSIVGLMDNKLRDFYPGPGGEAASYSVMVQYAAAGVMSPPGGITLPLPGLFPKDRTGIPDR